MARRFRSRPYSRLVGDLRRVRRGAEKLERAVESGIDVGQVGKLAKRSVLKAVRATPAGSLATVASGIGKNLDKTRILRQAGLGEFVNIYRYARTGKGLRGLLGWFGPLGTLFNSILNSLSMGRDTVTVADLQAAARLLTAAGYSVTAEPTLKGAPPQWPVRPPTRPAGSPAAPAGIPEPTLPGSRAPRGVPPRPGEEPAEETHLVTNSSNVYSFSYDSETSTLYVTYLAPRLDSRLVSRSASGQLSVGRGAMKGKTSAPGPKYAYLDVPARVFQRMKLAHSKGKFVWDELRIRGTVFGHQYRYTLVQGSPVMGAVSGIYIPRKATKRGFRTRSVADVGSGRRGYRTSGMAQEIRKFPGVPKIGADRRRGGYGL